MQLDKYHMLFVDKKGLDKCRGWASFILSLSSKNCVLDICPSTTTASSHVLTKSQLTKSHMSESQLKKKFQLSESQLAKSWLTKLNLAEPYCVQPFKWGTTFVESRLFNDTAFMENTSFICNGAGKHFAWEEQDRCRERTRGEGARVSDWVLLKRVVASVINLTVGQLYWSLRKR